MSYEKFCDETNGVHCDQEGGGMRVLTKKELSLLKRQVRWMMKSIHRLEENSIIIMEMIDKRVEKTKT